MEELKQYLSGIGIGVKFRNNYSIEDHLGSIADILLYSKENGLLNYVSFPYRIKASDSTQLSLHNNETRDNLVINMNNIILDVNFSEKIPKEKSDEVLEEYFKALTQKIYKIVDIQDILRVGLVYKYIINDESSVKAIQKHLKEITFDDASSVTVNFSKKIILSDSKIKKDINDYENVICTLSINHDKKNEYFFQVDYQHIYEPRLASVIDIPYKKFVDKAASYNADIISQWIKKHG